MSDGGATNATTFADPNWDDEIKGFFDATDRRCMSGKFDLSNYDDVVKWSAMIYGRVTIPQSQGGMPLGQSSWSKASCDSFSNWIAKGFKKNKSDPGRPSPAANLKTTIQEPTWEDDIQHFFLASDALCMTAMRSYDLTSYTNVKANAPQIYQVTWQKTMPPQDAGGNRQWSTAAVETFGNWMVNGYPLNKSSPQHPKVPKFATDGAPRVRKNMADLDVKSAEFKNLKKAFETIMDQSKRPDAGVKPNDPKTWNFQYLAGVHYHYCMHHVQNFLTWHRVYIQWMEEALRTVEGCENVTMPYWDFLEKIPAPKWIDEAPFANYILSADIGDPSGADSDTYWQKGHKTSRVGDAKAVLKSWLTTENAIWPTMVYGMKQSNFEDFQGLVYRGFNTTAEMHSHDYGHNQTGPTMQNSLLSSFDPIFWFFHCNHDRLFDLWQQKHGATTLDAFQQHITKTNTDWLNTPPINTMPPFRRPADQVINLAKDFNVKYTSAPSDEIFNKPDSAHKFASKLAMFAAAGSAKIDSSTSSIAFTESTMASIRFADFNRLKVKGTFVANLYALDPKKHHARTLLDSACVFQVPSPQDCPSCVQTPFVHFHFHADVSKIQGKELQLMIETTDRNGRKSEIPGSIGEPKMNVRLLLDTSPSNAAHPQARKRARDEEECAGRSSGGGGCPLKGRRLESCSVASKSKK